MKTNNRHQESVCKSSRLTSTALERRSGKSSRGKSYIYAVAFLCLALIGSIPLTSCNAVKDKDLECKSYIKLLVYLPHQYGTKPLRAEGTVTEKNDLSHSTEKATVDAERYVGRLLVTLKDASGNVVFAKTFNTQEAVDAGVASSKHLILKPYTNKDLADYETIILEATPGTYTLQTWANLPVEGYTPNNIYTTEPFKNETTLASLETSEYIGLPMASQPQSITIQPNIAKETVQTNIASVAESTPNNIFHVDLERMISKVEVNLRNTDDNNTVFPESKNATIESVELVNANKNYKMSGFPDEAFIPSTDTKVSITHSKGEVYNQEKVLSLYMAPRTGVTKETATAVKITAKIFNEENVYTIPLYDQETPGTDPKKYDIVRNTIYRINARLKGHEIIFDTPVLVEGWYVESPKAITIAKEGLTNE